MNKPIQHLLLPRPPEPGAFGAVRKYDVHTGVDLYCAEGEPVHAVEAGEVVGHGPFTGPEAESPWWMATDYLAVRGESGVIVYGEIELAPGVLEDPISLGQTIGFVRRVLQADKGRPMTMLHLELYDGRLYKEPVWWRLGEPQPEGLLDPTALLARLVEPTP